MRLAIVSLMGGLPWGGSEALWHAVAKHALSAGDQVFVSVYNWGALHEKLVELKSMGAMIRTRRRFNAQAGLAERISRFVRKHRPALDRDYQSIIDFAPDAVFISQGDSFDLAIHHRPLYELLQKHQVPYSIVCHNHAQYSYLPPVEIFPGAVEIFQNARTVYFVSNRQWQLTERRLAMSIRNGALTWNPLNMDLPEKPLAWPRSEKPQLAMVANLSGTKGHDTAFEVFSSGVWKERSWQLNLYGSGEGMTYLKALAAYFGIADKILFKGHVQDIQHLWRENHLLLVPSAGEGLPISLVEAMACGRPAVVTDVGGNTEVVINEENGFVAAAPTAGSFSTALQNAWDKKERWERMGKNAFEQISLLYNREPAKRLYDELKHSYQLLQDESYQKAAKKF